MFIGCCRNIAGVSVIPPNNGGCDEWLQWHKDLVKQFGRTKANEVWINYWNKLSPWSNNANWCKYNNEFSGYLKSQGIDIGNIFSDIFNAGTDVVEGATDTISLIGKILPVLAIGVIGYIIYKELK